MSRRGKQGLMALFAGTLFGAGLGLGGMLQPRKVIGFLDFGGQWDPSLALVMAGALAVHALAYRVIRGTAAPLLAESFAIPTRRDIDYRLIAGAALFGMGWGLAGYCPGPAIASLGSGRASALVFVLMLLLGMALVDKLQALAARRGPVETSSEAHSAEGAS